ncbi:MAG: N-formylglutamate amidohydrolase [Bacteriovoracaceae bacterium]|jgi:N-formylglutamate amidohydrolase
MKPKSPILISVPHSGIQFPEEVRSYYNQKTLNSPADTDWFIDQLYNFAPELDIEIVVAPYSRYVIDLNRDPESKLLYQDSRQETGLIPSKSFSGKEILLKEINQEEAQRRIDSYYWPYYKMIQEKLDERIELFSKCLLFDAHSIKRLVPKISKDPFPDMIIGDADETSADKNLIDCALKSLRKGPFEVAHNHPFKGGHITRYFGKRSPVQHALQLEMSQDLYMNEQKVLYDEVKALKVQAVLRDMFEALLKELS